MKKIFVNFSNHPSTKWSPEQTQAAHEIAKTIVDIPFPNIDPRMDIISIRRKACSMFQEIIEKDTDIVIMCQGESSFMYTFITECQSTRVPVFVATSERVVEESISSTGETVKNAVFKFVQFREI